MDRRFIGAIFCFCSTVLYGIRYIAASLYGANTNQWDSESYQQLLSYIGTPILHISILLAFIGVGYIILGEIELFKKK